MLKTSPAVFAVGKNYQIMVPVTGNSLFWVEIDGKCFYDEQNGIMRSLCSTHRVTVPAELLDRVGRYTVCEREIIDRKPYFPLTADTERWEYEFRPVPADGIRIYHVADAHNMWREPIAAAEKFGKIDLLIMNGDIPNHSGDIEYFDTIYKIAEGITHGNIPVVFARGNHDLRGYHAEEISDYTPNEQGNTYYSFRVGNIWGLALDCGEDKDDGHPEYGLTVACHQFRERETEYIRSVIKRSNDEYNANGVLHRLIVCHNPFTYKIGGEFNIEEEIFTEWAQLIKENISPELMICGHLHVNAVSPVGGEYDDLGQPCTLVLGSEKSKDHHSGCGITLYNGKEANIEFYSSI